MRGFFRRVLVHGAERIPHQGPLLVIANHPATWTDAVLLEIGLGRRFHFLVHSILYRPTPRGWVLRLFGAQAIYHRADTPGALERNETTSRACLALFDAGEAVVTFPEGVSLTDWHVEPFKTGAARLALEADVRRGPETPFMVIPVGLYYRDRTAARSEVELAVGAPIDLAPYRRIAAGTDEAARALTQHLFERLTALVVHARDAEIEMLAKEVLPILPLESRESGTLTHARALVVALESLAERSPGQLHDLRRRVSDYRRACAALGIERLPSPRGASRTRHGMPRLWAIAFGVGAPVALAGWAIHAVPEGLTELAARRFAARSTQISFGRIVAGLVFFPLSYLLLGWAIRETTSIPHAQVVAVLASCALAGCISLPYRGWLRERLPTARLFWLERRGSRLVDRAHAAREAVLELLSTAGLEAGLPCREPGARSEGSGGLR